MKTLIVYSSLPVVSSQLAGTFYALAAEGVTVTVRPLGELRAAQLHAAEAQLLTVTVRLVTIAERFNEAEKGRVVLALGEEPGLRAEADDLRSRQRGLQATIRVLKGGVRNG